MVARSLVAKAKVAIPFEYPLLDETKVKSVVVVPFFLNYILTVAPVRLTTAPVSSRVIVACICGAVSPLTNSYVMRAS